MKPINTNDAFKETIQSDNPVIVKFEAGWCPDCKAMDMWIDPIQEKYNDYGWLNGKVVISAVVEKTAVTN